MEYLAQMGPMLLLGGLVAAWLTQAWSATRGPGLVFDIVLGLLGSVAGGLLVHAALLSGGGMLGMLGIGAVGAVLAIGAQRRLWHVAPERS